MSTLLSRRFLVPLLAAGAGMGVPLLATRFGFVVAWFPPRAVL